jgi:hypothetical protein
VSGLAGRGPQGLKDLPRTLGPVIPAHRGNDGLPVGDAGISADVICRYVHVELAALDGLHRMAEAKLLAAQNATDDRYHGCR